MFSYDCLMEPIFFRYAGILAIELIGHTVNEMKAVTVPRVAMGNWPVIVKPGVIGIMRFLRAIQEIAGV